MKKIKNAIQKWRMRSVLAATLAVILAVGTELAVAQSAMINMTLGCTTYKIVSDGEDDGDYNYYPTTYSNAEDVKAYGLSVCEEVEGEGIVLLKNANQALPLDKGSKVSCFLYGSANLNYATSGSSSADTSTYKTLKAALETDDIGLSVNPSLWSFYTEGNGAGYKPTKKLNRKLGMQVYAANAAPWSELESEVSSISEYGDAAIVVITRASGEGMDISTTNSDGIDGSYLSLSENELELLRQLKVMKDDGRLSKIVVLLNSALAIRTDFIEDDAYGIDAAMWIGNLGSAGIDAVADVLVGNTVPSGRLTDTYVADNFSSPAMASWILNENGVFSQTYTNAEELGLNSTQMYYGVYSEGIYVGYRYYETRYEDTVLGAANVGSYSYGDTVVYPFGYGLSYTQFKTTDMTVSERADGDYDITVTIINIGDTYAGKEVVQVYLQKPYTEYDRENGVEKASVELVGFAKTKLLAPGESQQVTITVEKSEFKSYDVNGAGTYIVDAGDYYLAVGSNAHDALNNILSLKGFTEADGMDASGEAGKAVLVWQNDALDTTTYAVSEETGTRIENQLAFCDPTRYDGIEEAGVLYVSRNDWEGTWPTAPVELSVSTEKMSADISSYKAIAEDEDAEMPTYGAASGLTLAMLRSDDTQTIAYDDSLWDQLLDQMTFSEQALLVTDGSFSTKAISSVALSGTAEQDGPTGVVGSVNSLSFPSEGIWASTFNTELIAKVGDALAEDARINDLQGLYLPGINIHRTPFGGRTHEYFSEDPFLTGIAAEAEIKAVQAKGVIVHVKHYIFNDEEAQRNGICIWLGEQSAREIYLKPWAYAVKPSRGNAHAIMTSFNRAGCLWTSASSELMDGILRGEMGFDGYAITDMASSNAAYFMTYVDGFMNGTDLYLGAGSETALDEYRNSPTFAGKVRESAHRLLYVIGNYSAAMNGISSSLQIVTVMPWWQIALYCLLGVSTAFFALSMLMTAVSLKRQRGSKINNA